MKTITNPHDFTLTGRLPEEVVLKNKSFFITFTTIITLYHKVYGL